MGSVAIVIPYPAASGLVLIIALLLFIVIRLFWW